MQLTTPLLLGNQRMTWQYLPTWSTPYMYSINMTNHLPGYLAQFNVWQRVLSSAEIQSIATLGLYTNNAALVVRYAFAEQGGQNVSDSGGSGLNLWFNRVALFFQQQPAWSLHLQPLCLLTPTSFAVAGPPSSPNCQAANASFTVTVSVLDSAGAVVTQFNNGSVSLNATRVNSTQLASNVSISPAAASFTAGVATFTVLSTTAQTLTLHVVDSARLLLSLSTTVISVRNLSSLTFTSTFVSAPKASAQSISAFASTCQGLVQVPGPFTPALTASLTSNAANGHLTPATPLTLSFNASGWASTSLTDSFNEAVTFSLVDTSGRGLSVTRNLTAYWTAASPSQLLIAAPYPGNGSQPTPGAFYAGVPVVVPVYAADSVGGPVAAFSGSTTVTVTSPTGVYAHVVALTAGSGSTTFTPKTPGVHSLSLSDSSNSGLPLGPVVALTVVGGMATTVVFASTNVTRVTATQYVPLTIPLLALDVYGNVAFNWTGQLNVSSTSFTGLINGGGKAATLNFSNSAASFAFNETTTSGTPAVVTLFLNDSYATGLNVSAQLTLYVQPRWNVCPAGTQGSGALWFAPNSAGVFQNTGDLINLGTGDFSMSVWSYVLADSRQYFASQSWYPSTYYQVVGSTMSTMFAGTEQIPTTYGVSLAMGWYTSSATAWQEANYVANSQFNNTAQWAHWVFTFTASTQSMAVYFNSRLVAQKGGASWATIAGQQPRGSWHLGLAPLNVGRFATNLWLDDLRVYTRALTPTEIGAMYTYNTYANPAGLYMHYAFDEGLGLVSHDSVSHFDVPSWNYMNTGGTTVYAPTWLGHKPNCLPTTTALTIVAPASVRLDQALVVILQGVDAYGNPSVSFNGQAQLQLMGSSTASLSPASGVVNFTQGQATVSVSDTVPETVTLSLLDFNSTGLVMSSTAVVQFFAGSLSQLVIVSAPSQQAGSGLGSLVVVQCQDQYGNHVTAACTGTVSLRHNSSSMQASSPVLLTLSASSGTAEVTLVDSRVEAVALSLQDTGGLGVQVSSTALLYSTGAPYALVAGNASIAAGAAVQTTVDTGLALSLQVVDAYGTLCNYAQATTRLTLSSPSGLAVGGGVVAISNGQAVVQVSDSKVERVLVNVSQSAVTSPGSLQLLSPSRLVNVSFAVGAAAAVAVTNVTWLGKPQVLLLAGSTAYLTLQVVDQYANPVTAFAGQVIAMATAHSGLWVGSSLASNATVSLVAGSATLKLNDSSAEVATVAFLDSFSTNLSMPAAYAVPYSSGACVQYVVSSVLGSAYYDFPIVNPGTGIFTRYGRTGSDVPMNLSQSIQMTVQCQDGSGAVDASVQGLSLTATFSHNQSALINGPCTFVNGSCFLYFQSFAAGNMTVNVSEAGARTSLTLPAPTRVLFAQLVPIIWNVSPQQLTTDGSTIVPQVITITGQGFMCGQNFTRPPLVQLSDPNTTPTLVTNCTVTYFNSSYVTCLLPAGQGKPEVIIYVCGVRQLHLPRWPTDAYFYVFGSGADWCTPMQNWWDIDGHTWHDNTFCLKYGHALLDVRFYQPPGVGGQVLHFNLPTSNGQPQSTSYAAYSVAYPNQPYYPVTSFPSVPPEVLLTHRCTQIQELEEPYGWPNVFLCLPKPAPYQWSLVRTGPAANSSCVPIREGSDPAWSDGSHYMCTPLNTPYPDVDGIQMFYYQAPYIASITPATTNCSGNVTLTMTGTSFGLNWTAVAAQGPLITLTVGSKVCAINPARYNHTYLECLLPPGETLFNAVVLTVEGVVASNTPNFPFLPPVILSIAPPLGYTQGGDLLTIVGYNFGFSTAAVSVGGASCSLVTLNNTMITCYSPSGAGVHQAVYVTTNLQRNLQAYYWSYAPPTVLVVAPATFDSIGGATLTVQGNSFGSSAAVTYVGGALCPSVTGNDTLITCTLPAGQGYNLTVSVVQSGQSSNATALSLFSYLPPNITAPPSPAGAASGQGAYITLTGLSFGVSGVVTVNGLNCDWTQGGSWGHHQIYCLLPSGSGSSVPVQVLVGGQSSNNVSFTYSPALTQLTGASLPTQGGTLLTVQGSGFSYPALVNDSVTVNGLQLCAVVTQNESTITCVLPAGQGTANSVVVQGLLNLSSNALSFAYSPPAILRQSPSLSPTQGGVNVTLYGSSFGFGNASALQLNNLQVPILSQNHSALTFLAPQGSGVGKPLFLTVAGQVSAQYAFSYQPPFIFNLSRSTGPTTGNYTLTLSGSNFGGGTGSVVQPVVSFGGALLALLTGRVNDTSLAVTVPVGQGPVGCYVILDSQLSNTVAFTYDPPTLQTIFPVNASTAGGTNLTLTGASFGTTGSVYFYSPNQGVTQLCPLGALGYGQTTVQCVVPQLQGVGWQVYLISGGQTTQRLNFSYNPPRHRLPHSAARSDGRRLSGDPAGRLLRHLRTGDGGRGPLPAVGRLHVVRRHPHRVSGAVGAGQVVRELHLRVLSVLHRARSAAVQLRRAHHSEPRAPHRPHVGRDGAVHRGHLLRLPVLRHLQRLPGPGGCPELQRSGAGPVQPPHHLPDTPRARAPPLRCTCPPAAS